MYKTIALTFLGLALAREATADVAMKCQIKGTWVEKNDSFEFDANATKKDNGADDIKGNYFHAATEAFVNGKLAGDVWTVELTYSNVKSVGVIRTLTGKGTRVGSTISISGGYVTKDRGKQINTGTFKLDAKCK